MYVIRCSRDGVHKVDRLVMLIYLLISRLSVLRSVVVALVVESNVIHCRGVCRITCQTHPEKQRQLKIACPSMVASFLRTCTFCRREKL